ncbi:hypothetical protein FIBSPDRAFT_769419, partial [Athelia psychrophila]
MDGNSVKIIDQSWFRRSYRAVDQSSQALTDRLVKEQGLNEEQERAFRIVANHASCKNPGRLQMYMGGMGDTGKSQVLKTISMFFAARKESHRFIVVAPTGTVASLLDSSTYHSVFGINGFTDGQYINLHNDAATKANLAGVDYVFLDEVSLVSCRDLYQISCLAC